MQAEPSAFRKAWPERRARRALALARAPSEGATLDQTVLPQAFAKGDRVKVLAPFTTDDLGVARLVVEKGDHGVAWGTGDDGDLVTVFTRYQGTPNFVNLKFRKSESPPRRQAAAGHLRRPVAVS